MRLKDAGVKLRLEHRAVAQDLQGYDEVILASGVLPRTPAIPGIGHAKVASYVDVVEGRRQPQHLVWRKVSWQAAAVGERGTPVVTGTGLAGKLHLSHGQVYAYGHP